VKKKSRKADKKLKTIAGRLLREAEKGKNKSEILLYQPHRNHLNEIANIKKGKNEINLGAEPQ